MQCPNCSLYHPARYDKCVSCNTPLLQDEISAPKDEPAATPGSLKGRELPRNIVTEESTGTRGKPAPPRSKSGMPLAIGITIGVFILLASAGGTVFFLTKPSENQQLLQEGQRQLALGQFAFALKTLSQAVKLKPNDPKALLSLARAYVGVDQVDKAWDCIVQAQQLGTGVLAEPQLATDLAGYYRQHNQYQRAADLLRPLAASNIPGKKAALSDLMAAWGDQALQDGDLKQAALCWEEIRNLHDGTRFTEADSRLATIYQKTAEEMFKKGDNDGALKYYEKLDEMAPSAAAYERTAELYQKQNKLELAIDQMRKAIKLAADPTMLNQKLAAMMSIRGKELLDSGDTDTGYGYLQEAQSLDPRTKAPTSTIRNVHVSIDSGFAHLTGEAWNPGPGPVNMLSLRSELFDTKSAQSLWSKDIHIIDEFVPPLAPHDQRPVDIVTGAAVTDPENTELRIYLNGSLYRAYPLGKLALASESSAAQRSVGTNQPVLRPRIIAPTSSDTLPPTAPNRVVEENTAPAPAPDPTPASTSTPEEKTLKDLD